MSASELVPEAEARKRVLADVTPIGTETVALGQAHNRILSSDLLALRTQPPFPASLMDGYAVRAADVSSVPVELTQIGVSRAGVPFNGQISVGETVRIFTGATIPEGADCIVIQENVETGQDNKILVQQGEPVGKYVRPIGLDFSEGETLLKTGDVLTPSRLSLAASMNHPSVPVFRKPKVALISSGDELVMPGNELKEGQIIASNAFAMKASVTQSGADIIDFGIVKDCSKTLIETFQNCIDDGCDLIITTGGASVGDHDLVLPAAMEVGFEFEITKIAMRPGKPFLFGRHTANGKTTYLTGLAGNPVSSIIAFNVFVRPLIGLLGGADPKSLEFEQAQFGCDVHENDSRAEYMRGTLSISPDGAILATPFSKQDSSMLSKLVASDCLIYRAVKAPAAKAGEPCKIIRLDRNFSI